MLPLQGHRHFALFDRFPIDAVSKDRTNFMITLIE